MLMIIMNLKELVKIENKTFVSQTPIHEDGTYYTIWQLESEDDDTYQELVWCKQSIW